MSGIERVLNNEFHWITFQKISNKLDFFLLAQKSLKIEALSFFIPKNETGPVPRPEGPGL